MVKDSPNPLSNAAEDLAIHTLYCKVWRSNGATVSDGMFSQGGLMMFVVATVFLDSRFRETSSRQPKDQQNSLFVIRLLLSPLFAIVVSSLLLMARSKYAVEKYISDSKSAETMHFHINKSIQHGGSRMCYVVETKNPSTNHPTILGFIVVKFNSLLSKALCVVEYLVVDVQFRRKGIATALLHSAENYVKKLGASRLSISVVNIQIGACHFYASSGYTVQSNVIINSYGENELRMLKIFE
ncbi:hypothetical protein TL16_g02798 [Triparma laevis f. inornata]|uniref:N-acetyltransferase domain-containing protein n=1 Tax=Triparma laevis f. inornata TaxID=1714386 RepID=A0A9W7DWR6_9STRA|nr:hypothetical protein TL16_g02798 [Triparma laevis f. inornata]